MVCFASYNTPPFQNDKLDSFLHQHLSYGIKKESKEIHTPAIIYNKYFCIKGTNYKPYTCTVVIFSAVGTVFHLTDK